jgi:hypothetical protein
MSIVLGSNTYNHISGGKHLLSTVTFGDPEQAIKLAPFTKRRNAFTGGAAVHIQADTVVGADTIRVDDTVAVQFIGSKNSDIARFRLAMTELHTFVQSPAFAELLSGRSTF